VSIKQNRTKSLHQCTCETCQQHPRSETAKEHRAINRLLAILDEKSRRRFVGLLALTAEHGDIQRLIEITGLSRNTICRGRDEIERVEPHATHDRLRRAGGGRKMVEKKTRKS
jgi:hypothetical protein